MNWIVNALVAGSLFGVGIALTNAATRSGIPLAVTIGVFGLVWVATAGVLVNYGMLDGVSKTSWALLVLAALLFCGGNFAQFNATVAAPFAGYPLLVIAVVCASVTFVIDLARHYREGTLVVLPLDVLGLVLSILGLLCFAVGRR